MENADRTELPLTLVRGDVLDQWLRKQVSLTDGATISKLNAAFAIVVAPKIGLFNTAELSKIIRSTDIC
ncbi:MAG: hypothetical protein J6386_23640 [Candidatus Synoicihabitans palmerolidicus]|nr:hypothetical protein [Candidatus Synoicihabitans palmerolidicus]